MGELDMLSKKGRYKICGSLKGDKCRVQAQMN